jgi:UTP:GlnB (protein PII) uridylyltransferase
MCASPHAGAHPGPCTVLELSGRDRQGLLAEIMNDLSSMLCAVWSACIWTSKGRATFVLGVHDEKRPLRDGRNWQALQKQLLAKLGGSEWSARARRDFVVRCCIPAPPL